MSVTISDTQEKCRESKWENTQRANGFPLIKQRIRLRLESNLKMPTSIWNRHFSTIPSMNSGHPLIRYSDQVVIFLAYFQEILNPDFIFHNKLPKAGSSTMNNICLMLSKRNNFNYRKVENRHFYNFLIYVGSFVSFHVSFGTNFTWNMSSSCFQLKQKKNRTTWAARGRIRSWGTAG